MWVIFVIPDYKPKEIDFVAHDALPYANTSGTTEDVYAPLQRSGRFVETKRYFVLPDDLFTRE